MREKSSVAINVIKGSIEREIVCGQYSFKGKQ